jgi:serine/threonine-protein kinase HipA
MDLLVSLGTTAVGTIRSRANGYFEFSFLPEYLEAGTRLVLGQYFEDRPTEVHRSRLRLPPFFSNLLPEGGLRDLLARQANLRPDQEADLLLLLGKDLPGAVVVTSISAQAIDDDPDASVAEEADVGPDGSLRFSLAGVQLKFSVLYDGQGRGPSVPVGGLGGDWIAKLPSEIYEGVPETEYAMILWAARVGIRVPDVRLVRAGDINGLPIQVAPERLVFLSRRFDRPEKGPRVHQEDFAQVANVRRDQRYGAMSHTTIARIVRAISGEEDFDEVVRRTVFNVVIGNGDAHLKNWSLIYPDGIRARLSPAYDLVATVTYIPNDKLALKLSRETHFERIGLSHFERLADKVGVSRERVTSVVRDTVRRAMSTWPKELDPRRDGLLRAHVERLKLVTEAG